MYVPSRSTTLLKGHLNTHQRHVHEGKIVPSMKKHSCTVCGIKYPLWKMKKHMEIHQGKYKLLTFFNRFNTCQQPILNFQSIYYFFSRIFRTFRKIKQRKICGKNSVQGIS